MNHHQSDTDVTLVTGLISGPASLLVTRRQPDINSFVDSNHFCVTMRRDRSTLHRDLFVVHRDRSRRILYVILHQLQCVLHSSLPPPA